MSDKVNGRQAGTDEGRPLARGELRELQQSVRGALGKATGRETRYYLEDVRDQIAKILDPKFAVSAPAPVAPVPVPGLHDEAGCWPDYIIRGGAGNSGLAID
jgi:hypothetical protein